MQHRLRTPIRVLIALFLLLLHLRCAAPCASALSAPSFSQTMLELYTGQTAELAPLLSDSSAVGFSSSDESILLVDSSGFVSVVGEGRAHVTALFPGGQTASLYIRAINPVPARRALIISEQNYADGRTRTGAVNTAQGLSDMLGALRYRSGTPFDVTVTVDCPAGSLSDFISAAFSGAQSSDVSLFYIGCHGEIVDGEPCLLLHDGASVSVRTLEKMLRSVPGRIVVLLDFCQSGSFIGSAASRLYADSVASVLADSALLGGKYLVLTSCGAEQESYRISDTGENTEADMSTVFVRALCEGLGWDLDNDRSVTLRADSNRDGAVTFTELWFYTRRRVNFHLSGTGVVQTVMACPDLNEAVLFARQFS